jgi:4-hydroxybutyrate dehydrogenase
VRIEFEVAALKSWIIDLLCRTTWKFAKNRVSRYSSAHEKIASPESGMTFSTFSFPTTTIFGAGAVRELPQRLKNLGLKRPLVVTDPGLLHTDAFSVLQDTLGKSGQGSEWIVFSNVHPNPIEQDVVKGAEAYRQSGCDSVIAFGGGSALDAGKAVRLLVKQPSLKLADFNWKDDWYGLAPCIAIPTTAGTGSEVGRSSVIILEKTQKKSVLFHPGLLANIVLLDPELTRTLPAKLTAATGADALTHAVESYTSPVFHPLCDGIALEAIHIIVDALPRAYRDGNDLEARGRMLVAAAMGAVAFQKDLGATHSLAHPLSTVCGMHHGLANALCLPTVMRFNAARKPGLYRRVGIACGLDVIGGSDQTADQETIGFITGFLNDLGLRPGLHNYDVTEQHVALMAPQAYADGCHQTNPVPVTEADLRELYLQAL